MLVRYGKKIWLTEFAKCCTHEENEIIDFVKVHLISLIMEGSKKYFKTRISSQDLRPQNMFIDTHGLSRDTMKRIMTETGMWIQRMAFLKTTAQNLQKLAELTILCDNVLENVLQSLPCICRNQENVQLIKRIKVMSQIPKWNHNILCGSWTSLVFPTRFW